MPETLRVRLDLQAAYDEQYAGELRTWRELGAKYKAQNIRAVCQGYRFTNLLECGAGEGSILFHLDRGGFCPEMHAVEISPSGIAAIHERAIPSVQSVLQFNGYNLPYRDKSFDLAILSHVLEHVEHPRLLLRELKRVSRHQVIEVPLDYSLNVDQRVGHFLGYGHLNIFTPALLRFLICSEGFGILREQYDPGNAEVAAFQRYHIQGMRKTFGAEMRQRAIEAAVSLRRQVTPQTQRREFRYHAYCVLCEDRGEDLQIF